MIILGYDFVYGHKCISYRIHIICSVISDHISHSVQGKYETFTEGFPEAMDYPQIPGSSEPEIPGSSEIRLEVFGCIKCKSLRVVNTQNCDRTDVEKFKADWTCEKSGVICSNEQIRVQCHSCGKWHELLSQAPEFQGVGFNCTMIGLSCESSESTLSQRISPQAATQETTNAFIPAYITDRWAFCDLCEKWRRLPADAEDYSGDRKFECHMINISCTDPEMTYGYEPEALETLPSWVNPENVTRNMWVECEACSKWRRLGADLAGDYSGDDVKFECHMISASCEDPQEPWGEQEWLMPQDIVKTEEQEKTEDQVKMENESKDRRGRPASSTSAVVNAESESMDAFSLRGRKVTKVVSYKEEDEIPDPGRMSKSVRKNRSVRKPKKKVSTPEVNDESANAKSEDGIQTESESANAQIDESKKKLKREDSNMSCMITGLQTTENESASVEPMPTRQLRNNCSLQSVTSVPSPYKQNDERNLIVYARCPEIIDAFPTLPPDAMAFFCENPEEGERYKWFAVSKNQKALNGKVLVYNVKKNEFVWSSKEVHRMPRGVIWSFEGLSDDPSNDHSKGIFFFKFKAFFTNAK